MKRPDTAEQLEQHWHEHKCKVLRAKIVGLCNSEVLSPANVIFGKVFSKPPKEMIVECLREIANDIEKNTIILK